MNDRIKTKEVAVGILIDSKQRILFTQRPEDKMFGGWWELPGGKLEPGETPLQAVKRELQEELGITATHCDPWITFTHPYSSGSVKLFFYRIYAWEGTPYGKEGQKLQWSSVHPVSEEKIQAAIEMRFEKLSRIEETTDLVGTTAAQQVLSIEESIGLTLEPYITPILPATLPAIKWLQLPSEYAITNIGGYENLEPFLKKLDKVLKSGVRMVQFRELRWSHGVDLLQQDTLYHAFQCVLERVRTAGAKLLVNSAHPSDWWAEADGVHLQSNIADLLGRPKLPAHALVGVSTHNVAQLVMARRIKADFAILGNILPTQSHSDRTPIGWDQFSKWIQEAGLPVYALGGMRADLLKQAQSLGAHGTAGISQYW